MGTRGTKYPGPREHTGTIKEDQEAVEPWSRDVLTLLTKPRPGEHGEHLKSQVYISGRSLPIVSIVFRSQYTVSEYTL